ncbi:BsuPI-related putative proteinase inhibitor [Bacillus sp. 31A1R]|uniref:Intracellular proteinase inhibitor BsuPI domain-containing protein n=1 Tax=Robertmurraya mangrovi TaxID=3098077 RepID=A0ABU5IT27_9BACI|nr:BsuPI-related putative proteinase inhibitor [Bacillus sp. 31A1R]MDZ5470305.1 BsuPI-related putative proteinase inhibitor [Bacillus sp. 31A1R]
MKRILIPIFTLLLMIPQVVFGAEEKQETGDYLFSLTPLAGPESIEFELTVLNNSTEDLLFEFNTSQLYEIKVLNDKGEEVYLYSKDKSFTQALQTLVIKPNEKKTWTESWNYQKNGKRVQAGEYKARGELLARKINQKPISDQTRLSSETPFTIPAENPVFKNIKVTGEEGQYTITGEARPNQKVFYYTVEDGHNQYVEETEVKTTKSFPSWEQFKIQISISKNKLPTNASLILNLYEKDKDGNTIHTYPALLQRL